MNFIEEVTAWIMTHPKVAVALGALVGALVEAITGITVAIGDQVPAP